MSPGYSVWGGAEGGFLGITVDLNSCLHIDFLEFLKGVCRFPGGATHLPWGIMVVLRSARVD